MFKIPRSYQALLFVFGHFLGVGIGMLLSGSFERNETQAIAGLKIVGFSLFFIILTITFVAMHDAWYADDDEE